MTEDIISTSKMATVAVSEDQEATEVPKAMVIEKKLPDLLSLLESHAGGATPEVLMMPRPPTPVPLPPAQTNPADKKRMRDKKGGKAQSRKGRFQKTLLLNKLRWLKSPELNKEGGRPQRWFWNVAHKFRARTSP
nr:hypothetical protein CFP56_10903 [Quercus suber]